MNNRQVVLDTETTGLFADQGDRIIEVGCVEIINRRLTGKHQHFYVNPERESHPDALRIHGITNEFLLDKPKFHEIAEDLIEFCQGAEVIIHNAPFDVGFLNAEFKRLDKASFETIAQTITDTLSLAKYHYPGKRNSLDALCERLGVDSSERVLHGALLDAELLAEVYLRLTRGQMSLFGDDTTHSAQASANAAKQNSVNLRTLDLPVLKANALECEAHESVLARIDQTSGGKTLWRTVS